MAFPGAKVVVLCCFFVHFVVNNADFSLMQTDLNSLLAFVSFVQGGTLLFYPLLGLLADICFTRYKFIKLSSLLLLVSSLLSLVFIGIWTILLQDHVNLERPMPWYMCIIISAIIILLLLSVGMFEAVAIQFGMDQMVEASSDQLSDFIHWYYWSMNIGPGIMALIGACVALIGA